MAKNQHILAATKESVIAIATANKGGIKYSEKDFSKGLIRLESDDLQFGVDDIIIASRDILEDDENFMQIIPYVVVMRDGKILTYRRTPKGGEERLHGKCSIGFGGHIDIGDVTVDGVKINVESTVANAAQREISEELNMQLDAKVTQMNAVGMIVDRSSPVDRVHVGIVIILDIGQSMVKTNEDEIEIIGFKTKDELLEIDGDLEAWSNILAHGDLFV